MTIDNENMITCPLLRYLAPEIVFRRTPRGFHENLYLSALSLNSGAGRPKILSFRVKSVSVLKLFQDIIERKFFITSTI